MQHGIVKFDPWEDLLWVYNSVDAHSRTPLNGALIGINADDRAIKYTQWLGGAGRFKGRNQTYNSEYNAYCGCYNEGVNAIQPYDAGLIVSQPRGLDIISRDGARRMRVLSHRAELQIANDGENHIACSLLSCTATAPKIVIAANTDTIYAMDACRGQIFGTMKMGNPRLEAAEFHDQVTTLADLAGNRSRSSCLFSYYHTYDANAQFDDEQYGAERQPQGSEDTIHTMNSSMEDIAKKFGNFDAIPEFVPASMQNTTPVGIFIKQKMPHEKTAGAISLGYAMVEEQRGATPEEARSDITCVGMLSGLLHVVDHRMHKIAYTVQAHANAIANVVACGNTIVTTGCYLYGNTLMHEPMVEVHDIRMEDTRSIWLGTPVCAVTIVPRSNKMIALNADGGFYECNINTLEHTRYPNLNTQGAWGYHDVEVDARRPRRTYGVYTADDSYAINVLELPHEEDASLEMDPANLKPIFQKIHRNKGKHVNNTVFASMAGTFPGDVAQVFVQVFFFLESLTSIRYHCCEVEHCLSCQVGFAMHMLHVAHGNRKRGVVEEEHTYHNQRKPEIQATPLQELMPVDRSETTAYAIQQLLLWIIEKMNSELDNYYSRVGGSNDHADMQIIKNAFGFAKKVEATCQNGHTNQRTLENEFFMSHKHLKSGNSYQEEMTSYCEQCAKPVRTKYNIEFKRPPNFMIVWPEQGEAAEETTTVEEHVVFNGDPYTLVTVVFSVPSEDSSYRLLAYVRVPPSMKHGQEWLLINDGYVSEMTEEDQREIFDFRPRWKELITLIYRRDGLEKIKGIVPVVMGDVAVVNINGRIVPLPAPDEKVPVPSSIFLSESNIAHNPKAYDKSTTFVPLSVNEMLALRSEEFIVALDVECVKTGNETAGPNRHLNLLDSPGSDSPRKSGHLKKSFVYSAKTSDDQQLSTLARVSAVRGSGEAIGVPFLDHYIHRRKPPTDYLTRYGKRNAKHTRNRFSGIHQGDLDLKSSVHWLTTRKAIYLKIRYLIDAGCKILGHGLEQDFRMLNIVVPHEQVIDTVELFRLPAQRYMSLQFLTAHLLKRTIQQDEHDSVEDAMAALDLYKKYLEYKNKGVLEEVLMELYDIGYKTNWSVS